MDSKVFIQERFHLFIKESFVHLNYILRGGLATTLIVLFILGSIYYPHFLEALPADFPYVWVLGTLIGIMTLPFTLKLFIQEADLVFLTKIESKLQPFFSRALQFNWAVQAVLMIFFVLLILLPIYLYFAQPSKLDLLIYFGVPLLLKGWHIYARFHYLKLKSRWERLFLYLIRVAFSVLLMAWIVSDGALFTALDYSYGLAIFPLAILLLYLYERRLHQQQLQWYHLLDEERAFTVTWYGFVQQFMDIPAYERKPKGRNWLAKWGDMLQNKRTNVFPYLYFKTFVRSADYFPRFFWLSIACLAVMSVTQILWVKAIIVLVALYATYVQLKGIYSYHQQQFWITVMPVASINNKRSFYRFLTSLSVVQALIILLLHSILLM